MSYITSLQNVLIINLCNAISKSDLDFILMNFRCLKIINLTRPSSMSVKSYNFITSQVKKGLLRLQERDHKRKTIIVYSRSRGKGRITLRWPPSLPSQPHTNLQA